MVKYISILLSSLVFSIVVELVRKEKLTFKYAFGWISLSLLAIVFAVFDHVLFALSDALGFALPSNFIFFALICVLVLMSLVMTIFLCQQNRRNDTMAQKIGILQHEIERLESKEQSLNDQKQEIK